MHEDKRFDFLTEDIPTRELYARHRNDTPAAISVLRDALRHDARPTVRQNAIVALSASNDPRVLDDYIVGLSDRDSAVVSEAAFSITALLTNSLLAPEDRTRARTSLVAHANAIRAGMESSRERVRFNSMMGLEAIADRELDLAKPLGDEGSLIRSEGLKLAASRAMADSNLSSRDVSALIAFVKRNTDAQLHDDAMALLVRFAPEQAGPLLVASIADGTASAADLKNATELRPPNVVTTLVSYIESHPSKWTKEQLEMLVAFKAVCAAPALAKLHADTTDAVLQSFVRDALAGLANKRDASDAELVAWAKAQSPDAAPCR